MRILGKKIGKKQIQKFILIVATLALLMSSIIPFLSILIQWKFGFAVWKSFLQVSDFYIDYF